MPANDGRFAWLFVQGPMPGAAMLRLTVDGATIRAADGELLDADGDGQPGGRLEATFTTVSLAPLPGTTLSGQLVDPGPDLVPHTAKKRPVRAVPPWHTPRSNDFSPRPRLLSVLEPLNATQAF